MRSPTALELAKCCVPHYSPAEATRGLRSLGSAFSESDIEKAIQDAYGDQPFDLWLNGGALAFDDQPKFNLNGAGPFSVEVGLRANGSAADGSIIDREFVGADGVQVGYWIGVDSSGRIKVFLGDRNGNSETAFTRTPIPIFDGKDHYVGVVRAALSDGTTQLSIFFDRQDPYVEAPRAPIDVTVPQKTNFYIGSAPSNPSFPGLLHFSRLWRTALTADEIKKHIDNPPKEDDKDLFECWYFLGADTKGGTLIGGAELKFNPRGNNQG